jgi:hypothetical protein
MQQATVSTLLFNHDQARGVLDPQAFAMCIDAAFKASQACMTCSDVSFAVEDTRLLIKCLRLTSDCADACISTGWMLSREPHPDRTTMLRQLEACANVCQETAAECERLGALYPHTKATAVVCRRAVAACLEAIRICRRR